MSKGGIGLLKKEKNDVLKSKRGGSRSTRTKGKVTILFSSYLEGIRKGVLKMEGKQ